MLKSKYEWLHPPYLNVLINVQAAPDAAIKFVAYKCRSLNVQFTTKVDFDVRNESLMIS